MLAALCLVPGLFLGQAPPPTEPAAPAAVTAPTLTLEESPTRMRAIVLAPVDTPPGTIAAPDSESVTITVKTPSITPDSNDRHSIFSRPVYGDRSTLSWIIGTGPGRFNIIDWERRPNLDRYWWIGRWAAPDDVQLYSQIGFNIHWWAGPVANGASPAPDLPPRTYDLYLDCAWAQRWTDRITSEVRFHPGLYTDFRTTPPEAFRVPGQAVALFRANDNLFLVGGIDHLQRNQLKTLPLAGLLWQPTPTCELRLLFPEPKIAFELSSRARAWGYVAGEYGGGRWAYRNQLGRGEQVEYSDYRLTFGIEWREDFLSTFPMMGRSASFLEMAYVFDRHLRFSGPASHFQPDPAWMIRFGRAW